MRNENTIVPGNVSWSPDYASHEFGVSMQTARRWVEGFNAPYPTMQTPSGIWPDHHGYAEEAFARGDV